jgi:carbamoyl-phosphate synthase large subunit
MINCNPETVSTDYDTADRLYFQPLTFEDVMAVVETERAGGGDVSCLVQFGGQTPLKLALALQHAGVRILGTSPDSNRSRRGSPALRRVAVEAEHSAAGERDGGVARRKRVRWRRRLGFRWSSARRTCSAAGAMAIVYDVATLDHYMTYAVDASPEHRFSWTSFWRTRSSSTSTRSSTRPERSSSAASWSTSRRLAFHSGDSSCVVPPFLCPSGTSRRFATTHVASPERLKVVGLMNIQYATKDDRGLRARGEPARVADDPVPVEGDRRLAGQGRGAG